MKVKLRKVLNTTLGKINRGAVLDVRDTFAEKLMAANWARPVKEQEEQAEAPPVEVAGGSRK